MNASSSSVVHSFLLPLAGLAVLASQGPGALEGPLRSTPLESRGHGVYEPPAATCLSGADRRRIQGEIERNRVVLESLGVLPTAHSGGAVNGQRYPLVLFSWPVRAVGAAALDPGVHGISNFVDNDPSGGTLVEFQCGARTYDNHRGIDIFSWPFPWNRMAADEIHVVAAAPGVVVGKQDGFPDQSCSTSGGQWNAVYVQHEDGSIAWYGHLKTNSVTTRMVGERVTRGEYLGVMGSSGNSTGPHLHLEVYDGGGQLVDPFAGPCRVLAERPTWIEQPPYYDSAVNRLQVGSTSVVMNPCPMPDVPNDAVVLSRGALGYFTTFYRDQRAGQTSVFRIVRPDGSTHHTWQHASAVPHYAASWWWWSFFIPTSVPTGTWRFEVVFEGETSSTDFVVQ